MESIWKTTSRAIRVSRQIGMWNEFRVGAMIPIIRAAVDNGGLDVRVAHRIGRALHPHRPALVDSHRIVTYEQADCEINRIANGLRERFLVTSAMPVLLLMENRVDYVLSWFALFRLGALGVHANYRLTVHELEYLAEHSGARIVLVSEKSAQTARNLRKKRPDLDLSLVFVGDGDTETGEIRLSDLAGAHSDAFVKRNQDAVSENVVYTSGTTGKPKGAVRNFAGVGLRELFRLLERLPFRVADHHLVVCPLYHSGAQAFVLMQTSMGNTLHLMPQFSPEETLKALSVHQINSAFMVPTMISRCLDLPDSVWDKYPMSSLRGIVSGAAEFPDALRRRAIARWGPMAVYDFYGATELGWVTLVNGEEMEERPRTVGRPIAGQKIRIVDDQGEPLESGQVGVVYVKNEQTMSRYLHDPAATDRTVRDGWTTVEDTGWLDDDGYLYLSGRKRDMAIVGGMNVYPMEVEECLAKHESVLEVAVVGIRDDELGERLVAAVVVRDRIGFRPESLIEHAKAQLSAYKIPKRIELVDELPRNATGKVLKQQLRDQFASQSAQG